MNLDKLIRDAAYSLANNHEPEAVLRDILSTYVPDHLNENKTYEEIFEEYNNRAKKNFLEVQRYKKSGAYYGSAYIEIPEFFFDKYYETKHDEELLRILRKEFRQWVAKNQTSQYYFSIINHDKSDKSLPNDLLAKPLMLPPKALGKADYKWV